MNSYEYFIEKTKNSRKIWILTGKCSDGRAEVIAASFDVKNFEIFRKEIQKKNNEKYISYVISTATYLSITPSTRLGACS